MSQSKIEIKTWAEANRSLLRLARLRTTLAELSAKREKAIKVALNVCSGSIAANREHAWAVENALERFAHAHKAEFEGKDGRSYAQGGIVIGFRFGRATVEVEDGAVDWLRRTDRKLYVRVNIEPDRNALYKLLSLASQKVIKLFERHGVRLVPGEDRFFCEDGSQERRVAER